MKNTSFALILGISTAAGSLLAADTNRWDISRLDATKLPPTATNTDVTYEKDIKPIFQASCFRCHGAQRPRADLRLDSLEAALKGGKDGKAIVPGDSTKSLLVMSVSQLDKQTAMPPKPRGPRPGGMGGPGGPPGSQPPGQGGPGAPPPGAPQAQDNAPAGGPGMQMPGNGPGGPGPGGPGGPGRFGPPPKPLTSDQVALVRAWIDQGAK